MVLRIHNKKISDHPLTKPSIFRFTPLLILVVLLSNLYLAWNNSRRIDRISKDKSHIYVQVTEGKTIEAEAVDSLHREEKLIANFAQQWLLLAFSWNYPAGGEENYEVERGVKYPFSFYLASLAMKPGYREKYMVQTNRKYQEEFQFSSYISGQRQSLVRTFERPVILPVKNREGKIIKGYWDVKIVAIRMHAMGEKIMAQELFNTMIRLKAIEPVSENEKNIWGDTKLGKMLEKMEKNGLQVVEVTQF